MQITPHVKSNQIKAQSRRFITHDNLIETQIPLTNRNRRHWAHERSAASWTTWWSSYDAYDSFSIQFDPFRALSTCFQLAFLPNAFLEALLHLHHPTTTQIPLYIHQTLILSHLIDFRLSWPAPMMTILTLQNSRRLQPARSSQNRFNWMKMIKQLLHFIVNIVLKHFRVTFASTTNTRTTKKRTGLAQALLRVFFGRKTLKPTNLWPSKSCPKQNWKNTKILRSKTGKCDRFRGWIACMKKDAFWCGWNIRMCACCVRLSIPHLKIHWFWVRLFVFNVFDCFLVFFLPFWAVFRRFLC